MVEVIRRRSGGQTVSTPEFKKALAAHQAQAGSTQESSLQPWPRRPLRPPRRLLRGAGQQAILERIDPKSSAVFDGLGEELEADDGGGVFASARPA